MSEKNTPEQTSGQEQPKDKVGDIIRKERVTRRITVETIAKDLKLNAKYIKALEANEYDALPADPYVRVYLRSLAKYLSLNPEEILRKFYDERGMGSELYKRESSKIKVSMKEKEDSRSPILITALILIALLIGFSFFASKKGWINTSSGKILTMPNKASHSSVPSANDSLLDDSLFSGAPVQAADTAEMKQSDSVSTPSTTIPDSTKPLSLRLEVTGDSVWIQVFSDGKSWKNVVYKSQSRDFSAQDSFNIHVGNNSLVKYNLNGKNLKINGIGVVAFKCDNTHKPSVWTLSRWNTVFKDRL
jgi:cytoskeletal protein RodZ